MSLSQPGLVLLVLQKWLVRLLGMAERFVMVFARVSKVS